MADKVHVVAEWQKVTNNWRQVAENRSNGQWVQARRTRSGRPVFPGYESGTDGMSFTRAPGE